MGAREASPKLLLLIVILPAFLSSSSAQQAPNSSPGTRSAVVNVFDEHGNAVRDLAKEDFRVRLNGKSVAVLDARYSIAPRRIVVLLDMSSSMTEESTEKWQIAREAVDDLLMQTPRDVPIAMVAFAGKVREEFDFPQSRSKIAAWLREGPGQRPHLKHPATTRLFDAILEGLKLLSPIQSGDAVYAITDGVDNASQASVVKTRTALLQSSVRLFAFLFAEGSRAPDEQEAKGSFLSIVGDTGGFVFSVAGRQRLGPPPDYFVYDKADRAKVKVYTQKLNIQVNGFWTLELAARSSSRGSKMELEVVGHEGKVRKDVMATYPRVLSPAN